MSRNIPVIPAHVMRNIMADQELDNREIIINYLISEKGTVELTTHQEELRDRWEVADNLMRSNKYKGNEVARILCKKYNYGIATARRDMADAQFVFNSTKRNNKGYLLAVHIDRINDAIIWAMKTNSKLLPLLLECYTRAWKELPDDEKGNTTPAAIIFNINTAKLSELVNTDMTAESAKAIAEAYLKSKGVTIDLTNEEYTIE